LLAKILNKAMTIVKAYTLPVHHMLW